MVSREQFLERENVHSNPGDFFRGWRTPGQTTGFVADQPQAWRTCQVSDGEYSVGVTKTPPIIPR